MIIFDKVVWKGMNKEIFFWHWNLAVLVVHDNEIYIDSWSIIEKKIPLDLLESNPKQENSC